MEVRIKYFTDIEPVLEFETVEKLDSVSRGGFGSTGKR